MMVPRLSATVWPTDVEYDAFTGMHCHAKYRHLKSIGWHCPGCKRSLRHCMRWRRISGPGWRARYGDEKGEAWTIALHEHHDHGARWSGTEIICGVCNAADGTVKRKLKLPSDFSFKVSEIAQFVSAEPHGGATIDYQLALRIYYRMIT